MNNNNKPAWPIQLFFNYNANNGGKKVSIIVNGEIIDLNYKQFCSLTTFQLRGSENQYKIENNFVKTL